MPEMLNAAAILIMPIVWGSKTNETVNETSMIRALTKLYRTLPVPKK
jgi:hypothetical protein